MSKKMTKAELLDLAFHYWEVAQVCAESEDWEGYHEYCDFAESFEKQAEAL